MEAPEGFTTREEIDRRQSERLPALAARIALHPRPIKAVQDAMMQDAIELSSADVVESGRDFASLSDSEKNDILQRNYQHCMDRAGRYFKALEEQN
jgi:hypothetical protein